MIKVEYKDNAIIEILQDGSRKEYFSDLPKHFFVGLQELKYVKSIEYTESRFLNSIPSIQESLFKTDEETTSNEVIVCSSFTNNIFLSMLGSSEKFFSFNTKIYSFGTDDDKPICMFKGYHHDEENDHPSVDGDVIELEIVLDNISFNELKELIKEEVSYDINLNVNTHNLSWMYSDMSNYGYFGEQSPILKIDDGSIPIKGMGDDDRLIEEGNDNWFKIQLLKYSISTVQDDNKEKEKDNNNRLQLNDDGFKEVIEGLENSIEVFKDSIEEVSSKMFDMMSEISGVIENIDSFKETNGTDKNLNESNKNNNEELFGSFTKYILFAGLSCIQLILILVLVVILV
jgi:hypothetical protein